MNYSYVNSIPLYDLKVAAGNFSELQTVDDCEWIHYLQLINHHEIYLLVKLLVSP
jgi:hypothetical protein